MSRSITLASSMVTSRDISGPHHPRSPRFLRRRRPPHPSVAAAAIMALLDVTDDDRTSRSLPPSPDAVVDSIRDLASTNYLNHDPSLVHIRAGALFARLKALNRAANVATRTHKQATSDMRHNMDQTYLSLQNLLYEKRHLEREIEKCRQFASIYQDIPLYSEEEFLEKAPEALRTDETLSSEHLLMLNRLNFELAERQRLDQLHKQLVQQKEDLLKESKTKMTTMDSVKTQIDSLMKNALDVQKKVSELVQPGNPA